VDASCHELPHTHQGVWGEAGGVLVVRGCGGFGGPILEEHVPCPSLKSLVGISHEFLGGNVSPGWGGGVQDEREACGASLQGQGEVCKGVNREVFS